MKLLIGLFVAYFFTNKCTVLGQKTVNGKCSQFGTTQKDFLFQYLYKGMWYAQNVYDYKDIKDFDCITYFYGTVSNGYANITEGSKNLKTNETEQIISRQEFDKGGKGQFLYSSPDEGDDDWLLDVIATDYFNYTIEWRCIPNGDKSDCYIWIQSRKQNVDDCFYNLVKPILKKHNIDLNSTRKVIQGGKCCRS